MPMQPKPRADTSSSDLPNVRSCISYFSLEERHASQFREAGRELFLEGRVRRFSGRGLGPAMMPVSATHRRGWIITACSLNRLGSNPMAAEGTVSGALERAMEQGIPAIVAAWARDCLNGS